MCHKFSGCLPADQQANAACDTRLGGMHFISTALYAFLTADTLRWTLALGGEQLVPSSAIVADYAVRDAAGPSALLSHASKLIQCVSVQCLTCTCRMGS